MALNPYVNQAGNECESIDIYTLFQNTVSTLGNSTFFSNGAPNLLPNATLVDTELYKYYVDLVNGNVYTYENGFWAGPIGKLAGTAPRVQDLSYNPALSILSLSGSTVTVSLPNNYNVSFVYNQLGVSTTWPIFHDLHRYPSVSVVDSGGNQCIGEVQYIDADNLLVSFSSPFSGTAYLN